MLDIPKYILDGSGKCKSGYVVLGTSADYDRYAKLMNELNNSSEEASASDVASGAEEYQGEIESSDDE